MDCTPPPSPDWSIYRDEPTEDTLVTDTDPESEAACEARYQTERSELARMITEISEQLRKRSETKRACKYEDLHAMQTTAIHLQTMCDRYESDDESDDDIVEPLRKVGRGALMKSV